MEAADIMFEELGQANGASHNFLFDEEEEEEEEEEEGGGGLQW